MYGRSFGPAGPGLAGVAAESWGIVLITAVGLAVRIYHLGHQSLWVDEIISLNAATRPPLEVVFGSPRESGILGLYYLLLKPFGSLGSGETVGRLPSLIAGTLTIPALWRVVRHWFGGPIGVGCAAFVAISPFHVWYSQEARPYALLLLLTLLAIRSAQHLRQRPRSLRWRMALILFTTAAFYTHTVSLALFAFLGVFLLLGVPRSDWSVWLVTGAITVVLCLPGVHALELVTIGGTKTSPPELHGADLRVAERPDRDAPRTSERGLFPAIGYVPFAYTTGFSIGPSLTELHEPNPTQVALRYSAIVIPLALVIVAFLVAGAFRVWRSSRSLFWLVLLWLTIPICVVAVGTVVTAFPFNVRYTIIAYPAFVILLVQGAFVGGTTRRKSIAGLVLATICVWSLSQYFWVPRYGKENLRAAVAFITDHGDPGELVIASAPYVVPVINHYDDHGLLRVLPYPTAGTRRVEPSRLPTEMRRLTSREDRFWVLLSRTFHSDPEDHITRYLDQRFERQLTFSTTGVRLTLYMRR